MLKIISYRPKNASRIDKVTNQLCMVLLLTSSLFFILTNATFQDPPFLPGMSLIWHILPDNPLFYTLQASHTKEMG